MYRQVEAAWLYRKPGEHRLETARGDDEERHEKNRNGGRCRLLMAHAIEAGADHQESERRGRRDDERRRK